ncbi:transcriptional regulator with XRE-family HTH domain [Kitasatospora sp. GP30]|jgi:transcriptional regulator with XRE-family HTH domain|uniref:telomere-protecting terminal protein Tpg n=1 Tax=Kitasatospora sp. GP30 TaxID=3035084 RepID=UPI000C7104CD|nr:helix-turn-helix transcriptional regulator [Kitasatospora sp. GP30]MDH6145972.1 transcriptional regulator with XRE-family HTH domain [Kitasatospora sp. GP30]
MGKMLDGFRAAIHTRKAPQSWGAQFKFLMKGAKGSTKAVAERLGVSQRTVQRWAKGTAQPSKKAAETMAAETGKAWQPRVKERAKQRAATRGYSVSVAGTFGFRAAKGSTDDARFRQLTQQMPDRLVGPLWDAMEAGDEEGLRELVAAGLGEEYFRDRGRRADGLDVELTDVESLDLDIWGDEGDEDDE